MKMRTVLILLAWVMPMALPGCKEQVKEPEPPEPATSAAVRLVLDEAKIEGKKPAMPFVTINLEEKYVDLDGMICLEEGLLELVATVQASKEHEAIVVVKARPQHIHLAMLMLGLEPGKPGRWQYTEKQATPIDPTGDRVRISMLVKEGDKEVEKPIHMFIRNRVDDKQMEPTDFVFAGSHLVENQQGEKQYLADVTGDVIALVSFDAEVMALPTAASTDNAELDWVIDTQTTPKFGTPVKLRIRPAPKPKPVDPDAKSSDAS